MVGGFLVFFYCRVCLLSVYGFLQAGFVFLLSGFGSLLLGFCFAAVLLSSVRDERSLSCSICRTVVPYICTLRVHSQAYTVTAGTVASLYKHTAYKHNHPISMPALVPTEFVCEISINFVLGYACRTAKFCVGMLVKSNGV